MNKLRLKCLNEVIKNEFGELDKREFELRGKMFEEVRSGTFEILNTYKRSCHFVELKKLDGECLPVAVSKPLLIWLEKSDTFFAVFGRNAQKWHLIYLSPHYFPEANLTLRPVSQSIQQSLF